jgi:hypothetical protein
MIEKIKIYTIFIMFICSVYCWRIEPVIAFEPNIYQRVVTAIGDLPADHNPSLVLKEGRTVAISLIHDINSEKFLEDDRMFNICETIYDDLGQHVLVPYGVIMYCRYKVSVEQDIIKVSISAVDMDLDKAHNVRVRFSTPPFCTTNGERKKRMGESLTSIDEYKWARDSKKLQEELFISPVMNAELVFGVESEDHTSLYEQVKIGVNASGDRTLFIEAGYRINLQVRKDILFSSPFFDRMQRKPVVR